MTPLLDSATALDLKHRLARCEQYIIGSKAFGRRCHGPRPADWPPELRQEIEGAKRACKHYRALLQEQSEEAVA